jgi:hypothetical protein
MMKEGEGENKKSIHRNTNINRLLSQSGVSALGRIQVGETST